MPHVPDTERLGEHAHKSKKIVGCVGTRVYASNDDGSKSLAGAYNVRI